MGARILRIRREWVKALRDAIKHTERGGELIGCRPGGETVRFVVYDTDPG